MTIDDDEKAAEVAAKLRNAFSGVLDEDLWQQILHIEFSHDDQAINFMTSMLQIQVLRTLSEIHFELRMIRERT